MAVKRKKTSVLTRSLVVLVLALLILTVRLVERIGVDQTPADRFIVKKAVDGDTIVLAGGDKLRLLSIDTPEKGEPFYDEATRFLEQTTLEQTARIEFAANRRDKYGRLLGYLYIDTLFVNKAILENGLGYLYLFKDQDLQREEIKVLLEAQRRAIANKVGIWSLTSEPEQYYVALENSLRLHRPGCRAARNRQEGHYRTLPNRDAGFLEGLSPCRICKP